MEKLINDFKINFTKGDTYALAVKFKNITEDLRLAYFTVKENAGDEPLIQKSLGAGIDKIDDREYKKEKTYKVQLQSEDTVNLEARVQYLYDLRVTVDNVVKTVLSGVFVVSHSVAGASGTTTQSIEVAVDDEVAVEVETTPATNGIEYEQDPVASGKIGDLNDLATEAKETIVKAINEVKNGVLSVDEAVQAILSGSKSVALATQATTAKSANAAIKALKDGNGNIIADTYAKQNGWYDGMTVGNVNGVTFKDDAEGIKPCVRESVILKIGSVLSGGLGDDFLYLEVFSDTPLLVDDTLYYNGDKAWISEVDEDYYTLMTSPLSAFASETGNTITAKRDVEYPVARASIADKANISSLVSGVMLYPATDRINNYIKKEDVVVGNYLVCIKATNRSTGDILYKSGFILIPDTNASCFGSYYVMDDTSGGETVKYNPLTGIELSANIGLYVDYEIVYAVRTG